MANHHQPHFWRLWWQWVVREPQREMGAEAGASLLDRESPSCQGGKVCRPTYPSSVAGREALANCLWVFMGGIPYKPNFLIRLCCVTLSKPPAFSDAQLPPLQDRAVVRAKR